MQKTEVTTLHHQNLTKYPLGSLRELIYISIPLILSFFSLSFMNFCDRFFLARHSAESLQASVIAGCLCLVFQQPLMRITSMVQVFVGLYRGSNHSHQIGENIWQMIWFSLFSMAITVPIGFLIAPHFFNGVAIKESACTFFYTQMMINFLFPLGIALTSFFVGQGKGRIIFLTTLCAHGLNICLDRLFIFGIDGYFPSLGALGASLATCIAQSVFCASLFLLFLSKEYRDSFHTANFRFKWNIFWDQMKVSVPRAIGRVVLLSAWLATSHIMMMKGNEYLTVLSIGGSLIALFIFINDGISQALVTVASHLIGSKNYQKIWLMIRSALILLLIISGILSFPFLFFPKYALSFFFTEKPSPEVYIMLQQACIWIWLYFFSYGYNAIGFSIVTAARDMKFYMFAICFVWVTSFLPAYFGMNYWHWNADKLWLIMAFDSAAMGSMLLYRAARKKWNDPLNLELEKAVNATL